MWLDYTSVFLVCHIFVSKVTQIKVIGFWVNLEKGLFLTPPRLHSHTSPKTVTAYKVNRFSFDFVESPLIPLVMASHCHVALQQKVTWSWPGSHCHFAQCSADPSCLWQLRQDSGKVRILGEGGGAGPWDLRNWQEGITRNFFIFWNRATRPQCNHLHLTCRCDT